MTGETVEQLKARIAELERENAEIAAAALNRETVLDDLFEWIKLNREIDDRAFFFRMAGEKLASCCGNTPADSKAARPSNVLPFCRR